MVNGLHVDLPFLKLEDIVDKVERYERGETREPLSQRELNNILSRTFGPTADLLMLAKGKNEKDIFNYVTSLSINARFADTIEDEERTISEKLDAFRRLSMIYGKIDLSDIDVEELIKTDLDELVKDVLKGALDRKEELFIKQFGIGNTLRELRNYKPSIRNVISKLSLGTMIDGMSFYIDKRKLETIDELRHYCYFVAGTVGDGLNRIVQIEDGETLNFNNARSMGAYVQLTNILKNLCEDKKLKDYRIKFIPDELHVGMSHDELFDQTTEYAIKMRERVLEGILSVADEYFQSAAQYVIDIPRRIPSYSAFCDVALLLSRETLKLIRKSGAERVFHGEESAIKVSRPLVDNVVSFTYRGVQIDDGIKLINFLNDYRKNPDQYSFEPGECDKWALDVLGLKAA